ncbi:MAG: sensor histidine kinase [Saprospiraceae bacterium]
MNFTIFGFARLQLVLIGSFIDVIFFSGAVGYRLREVETAKNRIIFEKEALLLQKDQEHKERLYQAREIERDRIAKDLHDDIGSSLSSIMITGELAKNYLSSDVQKSKYFIDKITQSATNVMDGVSDLVWALQNNGLNAVRLSAKMRAFSSEFLSNCNIKPKYHFDPKFDAISLTVTAKKNIWLGFKESINNVCKYSKARNCAIKIKIEKNTMKMLIADDGTGISPLAAKGNGLNNLQMRTTELCPHLKKVYT